MFYFLNILEFIFKRAIRMTLPPKNKKEKKEYAFQRDHIGLFVSVMRVN
jgi:hypothetical protein